MSEMTPSSLLATDETVLHSFQADRTTYIRTNTWLAAIAMALGMAVLWAVGNPHIWTGAIGGLAAVLVRALYVASDEFGTRWDLTNMRILGPQTRAIHLGKIAKLKSIGSMVQIVTVAGDKHLIKYQADTGETIRKITAAQTGGRV